MLALVGFKLHLQSRAFLLPTRANIHQYQFNNPIVITTHTWFEELCSHAGQKQCDDTGKLGVRFLYTILHHLQEIKHLLDLWEPRPLQLGEEVSQDVVCSSPHYAVMATQTGQGEGQTSVLYKLATIQDRI